jgi:N-carbamoyl-L-amino-acid hydrolase
VTLRIDADRLRADIEELGGLGRVAAGGISRTSFGEADLRAREWYLRRCAEAGLRVETDGLGTMVVRGPGDDGSAPAVWSGSHIDTVPNGGRLDGALGSLAALECLRTLVEAGVDLPHPVRAVVFSDEEGNYDHLLGSVGVRRGYTLEQLSALRGRDGDRLVDRLAELGWDVDAATRTAIDPAGVLSFVELHIEQGPNLEAEGIDIGVVTSIVGIGGAMVEFAGAADHAGTTPMGRRKDALLAASDFLLSLPALAAGVDPAAVVTCGIIGVEPGGSNIVPGRARLTLDFRSPDAGRLRELAAALEARAGEVADAHGIEVSFSPDALVEPVALDEGVRGVIADAVDALGLSRTDLPSGAGHDSQNLAWLAPTGMIFVPSIGGKSHTPEEDTSWGDIANGANVLLQTLLTLAGARHSG